MERELPESNDIVMQPIPHVVRDFGVEARKAGKSWETAFNGPIHRWYDSRTDQVKYTVTVRLCRIKNPVTRELFSTNLQFFLDESDMHGVHNVYDMATTFPFTRIQGPRTPVPICRPREGRLWYEPNLEGVIMEDVRQVPITLDNGHPGFFVTGQGYRGKVMLPNGKFIHDVGVYGGLMDLTVFNQHIELKHLFGGIEFGVTRTGTLEDDFLAELGEGVWVRGIVGNAIHELHVESFKNSVMLPSPGDGRTLIGARSMSETKLLYYFETHATSGLEGYRMGGFIDGLDHAVGELVWDRVHRVGLGSNFIELSELNGYVGFIHVVLDRNNAERPDTFDPEYPDIEEQYEGWAVLLTYEGGRPVIKSCVRAITPSDVPGNYEGLGDLFDTKRVAFPISVTRENDDILVAYGWGDRALFLSEFSLDTVVNALREHQWQSDSQRTELPAMS